MLTVILADRETLDSFDNYRLFLKPLMESKNIAFCEMDLTADSAMEVAPNLHKIINNRDEWRALILSKMPIDRLNPFDEVCCDDIPVINRKIRYDWDKIAERLRYRAGVFEEAVKNPLVRYTRALGRALPPVSDKVQKAYDEFISDEKPLYKIMMEKCFEKINLPKIVTWMRKYGNDGVDVMVPPEEKDNLYSMIISSDTDGIAQLIGPENVPEFLHHISEIDTLNSDPFFIVSQFDEVSKTRAAQTLKPDFVFNDVPPVEIMCVNIRTCDLDYVRLNSEQNLNTFAEMNLYPENVKFFAFDLLPQNNLQYETDYVRFLTAVLVLAANIPPRLSIDCGALYNLNAVIDKDRFRKICTEHDAKLSATERDILQKIHESRTGETIPLENIEVRESFESDIQIPVEITGEYDYTSLRASFGNLGLSKDCPVDEAADWNSQYKQIEKNFIRYLREPRRCVKSAAQNDFVNNRTIVDERVRRLNEFQIEDIKFRLQEEEMNMAETPTLNLFNSEQFNEKLQAADKDIRGEINRRMTKKMTVCVGTLASGAFILGFLPMLLSNLNTFKSFGFSALMMILALAVFVGISIFMLVRFRKRLRAKFFAFNDTVNSINSEILNGLRAFSKYLSHACNVMRIHSVLRAGEDELSEEVRIMKKHVLDIEKKREDLRVLYSDKFDINGDDYTQAEPYDYDFKKLTLYEYNPIFTPTADNVEFVQHGEFVSAPVDYLKSVTVVKEERYE